MKHKIVSGLGVFLSLPVFAGARLPAVNVASAAVSARAQYGLPAKVAANKAELTTEKPAVVKRQVVARTAKRSAVSAPAKDTGEKIASVQEFLVPNRPSSNLWAKNEAPLRMPHADEFSVITSDVLLPEESIDGPTYGTTNSFIADARAKTAALDSQLEKFIEMQRKAEASVASNTVREIVPKVDDGVRLSRLVVPRRFCSIK